MEEKTIFEGKTSSDKVLPALLVLAHSFFKNGEDATAFAEMELDDGSKFEIEVRRVA